MRAPRTLIVLFLVLAFASAPAAARANDPQEIYRQALELERNGEYGKAEALYESLFGSSPENYNYYTRYKLVLSRQRKFDILIPVMEERLKRRSDPYTKMELGTVYYAAGKPGDAEAVWRSVMKGVRPEMQRSYANYVYRDMLEYGLGGRFYDAAILLREMTGLPDLLAQVAFENALRYQDWEHAAQEIRMILTRKPNDLRAVRQAYFSLAENSPFYPVMIAELRTIAAPEAQRFLSETLVHTAAYREAFEVLKTYPQLA